MARDVWRAGRWSVAAVVLVAAATFGALGEPVRADACSMGAMRFSFDGTIVSMDGPRITYRVDRVRQDNPFGAGQIPEPGGTVVVRYDGSPGELMPRESYRVKGWNNQSGGDGVSSQIAYDFHGDCGTGAGTTAIDGSYLGSSSTGFDRSWPYAAAGLVVALSVVLALLAAVARRYDRKLG